ncbi:MAG: hypothetical protein C4527_11135 [Candidatus Omnitrophota bacterium]|jgi:hypothetical protein|nr:MAG: hypothetical protein C4527_11135 [Candidatus Omnitrophota bacterium]
MKRPGHYRQMKLTPKNVIGGMIALSLLITLIFICVILYVAPKTTPPFEVYDKPVNKNPRPVIDAVPIAFPLVKQNAETIDQSKVMITCEDGTTRIRDFPESIASYVNKKTQF